MHYYRRNFSGYAALLWEYVGATYELPFSPFILNTVIAVGWHDLSKGPDFNGCGDSQRPAHSASSFLKLNFIVCSSCLLVNPSLCVDPSSRL